MVDLRYVLAAPAYTAVDATVTLLLPGDTTTSSTSWRVIRSLFRGGAEDYLVVAFAIVAVLQVAVLFRRRFSRSTRAWMLLAPLAWWTFLGIAFTAANANSTGRAFAFACAIVDAVAVHHLLGRRRG